MIFHVQTQATALEQSVTSERGTEDLQSEGAVRPIVRPKA